MLSMIKIFDSFPMEIYRVFKMLSYYHNERFVLHSTQLLYFACLLCSVFFSRQFLTFLKGLHINVVRFQICLRKRKENLA